MAAAYDLTPRMAPFLDAHLLLPLLDSLKELKIYDGDAVLKQKINVITKTNMVDSALEQMEEVADPKAKAEYATQKAALEERSAKILNEFDAEPEDIKVVVEFFKNESLVQKLKSGSNLEIEFLSANHGINAEALNKYYKRGKFEYECGQYNEAEVILANFLSVQQPTSSYVQGAQWGILACHLLTSKSDKTLSDFSAVKYSIESRGVAPLDQIRLRAWFLHWGLFVHTNRPDGVDALADLFTEKQYLQTMENLCPWLLRYYTAAVILSPSRRRNMLRDVLNEIQNFSYLYSDPITQFLESLYTQFDFDKAQLKLKECQELIKQDFFLQHFLDRFTEEARILICEMYCTINKNVDLTMLAGKLQLTVEEAEKFMVNMIRGSAAGNGAQLDAKIDSSEKKVLMALLQKTPQEQVMEKTRDLTGRSNSLSQVLDSVVSDSSDYLKARNGAAKYF